MTCRSDSLFLIILKKHPQSYFVCVSDGYDGGKMATAEHYSQHQITHKHNQNRLRIGLSERQKKERENQLRSFGHLKAITLKSSNCPIPHPFTFFTRYPVNSIGRR